MDRIRVLRIIEYEGPRDLVERAVSQSVHGEKRVYANALTIRAATIGTYPEILERYDAATSTNDPYLPCMHPSADREGAFCVLKPGHGGSHKFSALFTPDCNEGDPR